jgi:hypothetical protein
MTYTNDDFRNLIQALKKYADEELDQWDLWKLGSAYGEVFVSIRRQPDPDATVDHYTAVSPDMPLRQP